MGDLAGIGRSVKRWAHSFTATLLGLAGTLALIFLAILIFDSSRHVVVLYRPHLGALVMPIPAGHALR